MCRGMKVLLAAGEISVSHFLSVKSLIVSPGCHSGGRNMFEFNAETVICYIKYI